MAIASTIYEIFDNNEGMEVGTLIGILFLIGPVIMLDSYITTLYLQIVGDGALFIATVSAFVIIWIILSLALIFGGAMLIGYALSRIWVFVSKDKFITH